MIEPKKNVKNLSRMKDFGNDRTGFVRLDKNERTTPFEMKVHSAMMALLDPELIPQYPDQTPLYHKLSKFYGIDEKYFLLTSGSDAAIKIIYETYIDQSDEVIFLDPTYAMIEVYADLFGAKKVKIGYSADLKLDFDKLLSSITDKTRAVFIANPNQPTGTWLHELDFQKLLKKTASTNTLLIMDEAYQPFSGFPSAMTYVAQNQHLIVTQTFSKAYGLASARLGFIVAHDSLIANLYKVKTLADINLYALKLGEYLIDHPEIVREYVASIQESKLFLQKELQKLGVECMSGYANFIHISLPTTISLDAVAKILKNQSYLVRANGQGLPAVLEGCLRITVGPIDQMRAFLTQFKEALSAAVLPAK